MKKLFYISLIIVLASGFVVLKYFVNTTDNVEITTTETGNFVDVTIEKGTYEVGDIIYLLYDEQSSVSYFIEKVMALENDDVIAVYEVTEEDVVTLENEDLDISMEVLITDEEIEEVGLKKMQKSIKIKKVEKTQNEEQLQIKNNYEEKQQNFVEQAESNQNDNSNSTNTESGSNKTEEVGTSNQSDNANDSVVSNQVDNENSSTNSN